MCKSGRPNYYKKKYSINRSLLNKSQIRYQSVINRLSIGYQSHYQSVINQVSDWCRILVKIHYQSVANLHTIRHQSAYQSDTNQVSIGLPIDVGFWRNSTINRAARLMHYWSNRVPIWHKSDAWLITYWYLICHRSTCACLL